MSQFAVTPGLQVMPCRTSQDRLTGSKMEKHNTKTINVDTLTEAVPRLELPPEPEKLTSRCMQLLLPASQYQIGD